MSSQKQWIGRFAPTPSGPLHFGSLVAALGSYLIAKHRDGQWFVRIEDLDPPREVAGAASGILNTLEAFGFEWDGEVLYQSHRSELYSNILRQLQSKALVYQCDCSRKQIQQRNSGVYDSYCKARNISSSHNCALRIQFNHKFSHFTDLVLGDCRFEQAADIQDFVIRRRDGLYAYQLAVVADDIAQGVNHVVRGADILDSTPRQNFLYDCLEKTPPDYYHLPLVVDENGEKLSKSQFSPEIKAQDASLWLVKALQHLDQSIHSELINYSPQQILAWAIDNWQVDKVAKVPKTFKAPI